jgi:hypothetical protein
VTIPLSRREVLLLAAQATAVASVAGCAGAPKAQTAKAANELTPGAAQSKAATDSEVKAWPIKYGGVKPLWHDRLKTTVNGQPAIATLRFFRIVRVQRVEISPIVYGRFAP